MSGLNMRKMASVTHGEEHPLAAFYRSVRQATTDLAADLSDADATPQSMPDASPAKWHLAHTSWFFEAMVLREHLDGYWMFDDSFDFLFNSYYETLGDRHPRPARGLLTRPSLDRVLAYRTHVDAAMEALLAQDVAPGVAALIELGCHHEQQHQELLLTDILHLFAQNPLRPAFRPRPIEIEPVRVGTGSATFHSFEGGPVQIGAEGGNFSFDCEGPSHTVHLEPFRLADRLITNREWREFIDDGGYGDPLLWLSNGWATVCEEGWRAPLYWAERDGEVWTMTLGGMQPLEPDAPVQHISFFEADAFATWSCRRLPTEFEWEHAARTVPVEGVFAEQGGLRPRPAPRGEGLGQMFGDVWEWTRSAFAPYPRYRPVAGAVGEYNGKFMSGQYVLRGGSCVSPGSHLRASYRNFFPPTARWQFSGVRLADDM